MISGCACKISEQLRNLVNGQTAKWRLCGLTGEERGQGFQFCLDSELDSEECVILRHLFKSHCRLVPSLCSEWLALHFNHLVLPLGKNTNHSVWCCKLTSLESRLACRDFNRKGSWDPWDPSLQKERGWSWIWQEELRCSLMRCFQELWKRADLSELCWVEV